MNAQTKFGEPTRKGDPPFVISRGIEWTNIFGPGSGFTANPVRGCEHGCQWRMGAPSLARPHPNPLPQGEGVESEGKIVTCYAEAQRDRLDGAGAFKNITFHPDVFKGIRARKEPAGIFIDSMSDLLGNKVEADWIGQTISVMAECSQHVFFVLTKNPRRMIDFDWPDNVLLGLSAPPTFMYGKELTPQQQIIWFDKGCEWLSEASAKWKWLSLEPLSIDLVDLIQFYIDGFDWAVIGAGSDGRQMYQPDEGILKDTLGALTVPVFFKGNLDWELARRHGGWREEWPAVSLMAAKNNA